MTDIAFSSTVNASELKNSIVASSTQPHHVAMLDEPARVRRSMAFDWPGNQPFEIAAPACRAAPCWSMTCESAISMQDQHRHDRQQRVVRDGAREQQSLVGAKRAHRAQHECPGVRQRERGLIAENPREPGPHAGRGRGKVTAGGKTSGRRVRPLTPATDAQGAGGSHRRYDLPLRFAIRICRQVLPSAVSFSFSISVLPYCTFALPTHASFAGPANASHFSSATL